ncbi:MAG: hypothetical protein AAFO29_14130 [Actinomycetota bacterium]
MTGFDDAVDALYGGSLADFVANRDARAKEARAGGDRDGAAAIKALRKPTVAADALNRALRADPEAVESVLEAAERLRSTQEALLAGQPAPPGTDFAADQTAYRTAAEAVAAHAPSHEVEVRAAVDAAAIGGLAAELRAAAFATMPEPIGGLGPFMPGAGAGGTGARSTARAPRSGTAGEAGGEGDTERGADSERGTGTEPSAAERRMAERARKAAEQAVAEADAAEQEATEAAQSAADLVVDLDQELADLSERLEDLRARRDEAVAARAEADAILRAAAEQASTARAVRDELPQP